MNSSDLEHLVAYRSSHRGACLLQALFLSLFMWIAANFEPAIAAGGREDLLDADDTGSRYAMSSIPPGVKVEADLSYGSDPAQKLDLYRPQNCANAPVLFMVHGGAWLIGDKGAPKLVENKVARWVPKGFVFISINYRLSPKAAPLQQADDIAKALAFAQSRAKSWGADPQRFILMGHSAGAHLVDLLAADPGIAANQGAKGWLGTISLDSAAMDVVARMESAHQSFWDKAFGNDPRYWRAASPIYRLNTAPQPMLLVCSEVRRASCEQAYAFATKGKSLGARITVLPVALRHAEINQELGLPSSYTDAVDAFIESLVSHSGP